MTLRGLIETYGYAAIFVRAFLEGETVLMLGGFLGDQLYFF